MLLHYPPSPPLSQISVLQIIEKVAVRNFGKLRPTRSLIPLIIIPPNLQFPPVYQVSALKIQKTLLSQHDGFREKWKSQWLLVRPKKVSHCPEPTVICVLPWKLDTSTDSLSHPIHYLEPTVVFVLRILRKYYFRNRSLSSILLWFAHFERGTKKFDCSFDLQSTWIVWHSE